MLKRFPLDEDNILKEKSRNFTYFGKTFQHRLIQWFSPSFHYHLVIDYEENSDAFFFSFLHKL